MVLDWVGLVCIGLYLLGLGWIGFDGVGVAWIGLDLAGWVRIGLDCAGLGYIVLGLRWIVFCVGLDWTVMDCVRSCWFVFDWMFTVFRHHLHIRRLPVPSPRFLSLLTSGFLGFRGEHLPDFYPEKLRKTL